MSYVGGKIFGAGQRIGVALRIFQHELAAFRAEAALYFVFALGWLLGLAFIAHASLAHAALGRG